ncbi:hypothetical protein BLNAU_14720 [Blattamonas nauphoetae]|uniref:Protein kinase domain-containing protein n=1 Tax=Blattamonas nauphoetae TaxID=2049346 RepID=A0ABQ9XFV8_9EUKA|nr:hypothetical protein BLNAU_14720 [Blattamonas nauphoetae]
MSVRKDLQEPMTNSLDEFTFVASITNTSLCMEGFIFQVIGPNHGMIEVDSSTLWVSECTVLSEGSLSPFGISGGGYSGSSISILSTRYERSSKRVISLPPLTSLTRPSKQLSSTHDFNGGGFDRARNVVHGSGLCLDSIDLGVGTGPLFDFGVLNSLSAAVPKTKISLTHSSLRNVSSVAPERTHKLFTQTKQLLVSCAMEESMNHFSGTATADVNMCGSFVASNSSFAKCTSNLVQSHDHPTYTLSHRTETDKITTPSSAPMNEAAITRCAFTHMSGSAGATAVYFSAWTVKNIKIHECSFFDCNGSSAKSATVFIDHSYPTYPVTLTSCVVVRCISFSNWGGNVIIKAAKPVTVSDCVFYQTETDSHGSSVTIIQTNTLSSVTNSIIEHCYCLPDRGMAKYALEIQTSQEFFVDSLRFIDTQGTFAHDLAFNGMNVDVVKENVTNCQSSRKSRICQVVPSSGSTETWDDLFTTLTQETYVKTFGVTVDSPVKATFTIEVGDAVAGEMVVVVENLDSARSSPPPIPRSSPPPIPRSSPPPIPRSLTFDFGLGGTTASCTVDVGDDELIQSPVTDYNIRRAGIADWLVHTMRVKNTSVSFTDEMKTHVDITIDFDGLVRSADLKYATTYTIVIVNDMWGRALITSDAETFSTPDEPPRLIKMTHDGFDSTGENLIVRVRGRQMPVGTYTITLSGGGESFDVVFGNLKSGEKLEERDSEPFSIPIYGANKKILFNTEYTITDASKKLAGPSVIVMQSETAMTTPSEPARITAITKVEHVNDQKEIRLSWEGRLMTKGAYTVTLSVNGTSTTTLTLTFNAGGTTSTTTETLYRNPSSVLKYHTTYVVTGVKDSSNVDVIYNSGLTFTTNPEPTRLLSISSQVNCTDLNTTTLTLSGHQLPGGSATLTVVASSVASGSETEANTVNLTVSFARSGDDSTGTVSIPLYPTATLAYGETYRIVSLSSADCIDTPLSFKVPDEPSRLERIARFEHLDAEKVFELSWEGRLMTKGAYTVTLSVNGTSTTTLTLTFNAGGTTSTTTETLYRNPSSVLKYHTTYVVTGVKDSSNVDVIYNSGLTFTTNPEPTRLLSISSQVNCTDLNTTTLTLSGHQLPGGSATLTVVASSVASGSETEANTVNLTVSFARSGDDSTGTVSIPLYPTATLAYGETYRIVSLSSADCIDTPLSFKVPDEPSRLERIARFEHLDAEKVFELSWEGRLMTKGAYTVTLSVNGTSTTTLTLTFNAGGTTSTTTETLYRNPSSVLKYHTTYVVTGVKDSSNVDVIYNSGLTFTTNPEPTRLLSISSQVNCTDLNTTTLTLSGHQLPGGSATLTVVASSVASGSETEANTVNLTVSFARSGDDSTGTVSIPLYPTATLAYGETYRIVSLSSADCIDTPLSFKVPDEPTRLEKVTPFLSDDENSLDLSFEGRVFDSGVYELTLQQAASNADLVVTLTRDEGGTLSCSISTEESVTPHVVFGAVYTIAQITRDNNAIIINPKAKQFTVPLSPFFKSVSFEFTNSPCTSCKLVLTAEHVNIGGSYNLKLATGETFAVTFSTPEEGETGSTRIGWSDTLEYGREYTIVELRAESSDHPMRKQVSKFTTKPKPPTITLFVDDSSTFDDLTCGDLTSPCPSIHKAWIIADELKHVAITIKVLKETKETKSLVISKDISVLIENGMHVNGIIRIPASATHPDESALITVTKGTLKLQAVEVAVETSLESFVFLLGVNSTIVMKECVIDGVNIPVPNSDSLSICEWTSGVIQLDNCSTTIDWTKFHELPQGALNMKGGTITIDSSVFRDNTPNTEMFPSTRRNIVCSGEGEVAIGTLSSGDGTHDSPSAWMSLGTCHLNSKSVDGTKLLFIPTLDSNKTTSTFTNESYDVSLVGFVLMPCGLGLKLVEWDEKEKVEKRSTTIELAGLNSSEWKETSVNLKLHRSAITDIDHSLEIHARLAFGQNQNSDNHIVLKISDATAKKALTLAKVKKVLVWLIPMIAALILLIIILIIVLTCRRKRQQKSDKESLLNQELDPQDPIDVEKQDEQEARIVELNADHTDHLIHHDFPTSIGSHAVAQNDPMNTLDSLNNSGRGQADARTMMRLRCGEELVEVPVNVNSTLYNRLHKGGPPLHTQHVFRTITQGLAQIARLNPKKPILTNLSPLWVYLDELDNPIFQNRDDRVTTQTNNPESSFFRGSDHKTVNQTPSAGNPSFLSQSLNGQSSNRHSEGQRWMAPEVAAKKGDIDASRAAVFSLGLILWEMETGLVPFGEVDAVNAQRQLGTGSLPLMNSWTNESKIELVRTCLTLDHNARPTLEEIWSLLESDVELGKPAIVAQNVEES